MLKAAEVTLKLLKCKFAAPEVPYLGYLGGREGLRVDHSKTAALRAATPPDSKTGIRRFLGMCGVYHLFVHGYEKYAAAMTRYFMDEVTDSFDLDKDAIAAHV